MKGKVTKSMGLWYEVLTEENKFITCRAKGKMRLNESKTINPIAVGDLVKYQLEPTQKTGVIHKVLERENYVIRKSPHKTGFVHIIAANIDLAVLVATISQPSTSQGFIDRFLVAAESFRIPAAIIFNKSDLYKKKHLAEKDRLSDIYTSLGYQCLLASAKEERGVCSIKRMLMGKTTLFTGHSGVGKSTLLNLLSPYSNQKTAKISDFKSKGRGVNTTTFAEMLLTADHTAIIDTPGIKELGLMDMEASEISHYFPEMRNLMGQCKFHNCTHTNEPSCAVLNALAFKEIDKSRYKSYISMVTGDDNRR